MFSVDVEKCVRYDLKENPGGITSRLVKEGNTVQPEKPTFPAIQNLTQNVFSVKYRLQGRRLPTTNLGVVPCFKVGLDLTLVDKRGVSAVQRNFETVLTSVSLKEKAERSRANQVLTLHTESCKV